MKKILTVVMLAALIFPSVSSAHDRFVQKHHRYKAIRGQGHYRYHKYIHGDVFHHHHGTIIIYTSHRRFVYPRHRYGFPRYKRLYRHHYRYTRRYHHHR